jgi:Protoglobin
MRDPTVAGSQPANSSLAPSSGGADEIMAQLSNFLDIDDLSRQYARVLLALFTGCADDIVGEFYRKIQKSAIGSYITDDAIERLIPKQKAHWMALFNSDFGRDYVQSVRRIGIQHRDIALNPSWYVAGYVKLKLELMQRIAALDVSPDKKISLMLTLEKYVAIDMALALTPYDSVILD